MKSLQNKCMQRTSFLPENHNKHYNTEPKMCRMY